MEKFVIEGGKKLTGKVAISGAKNSSLALMPATILSSGTSVLYNTPELNDVYTMIKLLKNLGAEITFDNYSLSINTATINNVEAPYEHVKKMRASVYVLGSLLAKYGKAKVSLPGGCAWGPRPINLHLEAMKSLGAEIKIEEGYVIANAKKLTGAKIDFNISSVGATGNALMAAVLAKGSSVINNAAMEPEIIQLCNFLFSMGAKIDGIGTTKLEVEGVEDLNPAEIITIADRIETGTLLIAGAITRGRVKLINTDHHLLNAVTNKLKEIGCKIHYSENEIEVDAENIEVKSSDVSTSVFPGFPTDMQAQWMALMSLADGKSFITDTIYSDRFNHVPELIRLGAEISVDNSKATITGTSKLKGAKVMSTDLRASACLVLAGLTAEGTTEVLRVYHLDRGYQRIDEKLKILGANIKRIESKEF
ncbi:MAG: UDP-N-acetylglucosamine 1-carboxyvinyltransferase [Ignavibacteriaceae bacterium]|nr:UDP-N-acetylglucosamine 1-carboxyvinyltransferase [Ignavibacteriaceae bacterium]